MKKIKFLSVALVALLTVCCFSACNTEDGYRIGDIYPMALVTVKPYADMSGCYLQLDNNTTLYPTNVKGLPYGTHPVRAIIEYLGTDDDPKDCDRAVKVVKMIRTRGPNAFLKSEKSIAVKLDIMEKPTKIRAMPVTQVGIIRNSGLKKMHSRNPARKRVILSMFLLRSCRWK